MVTSGVWPLAAVIHAPVTPADATATAHTLDTEAP
jgi:hypothetical protein